MNIKLFLSRPHSLESTIRLYVFYGAFIFDSQGRKKYVPYRCYLPYVIPTASWDKERQRVKISSDYPQARLINNTIDHIQGEVAKYENKMTVNDGIPSEEGIHKTIQGALGIKEEAVLSKNQTKLSDLIKLVISKTTDGTRLNKDGSEISEGVIRKYENAAYHLKNYEQLHGIVKLKDVNKQLGEKLHSYFNSLELAHNTKISVMRQYKTFINYAIAEGYIDSSNFHKSVPAEIQTDEIALTESEINRIFDLKLDGGLELNRDVFIVGIWTMLRWQDYSTLQKDINLQGNLITVHTTKTREKVVLPIHWQLTAILQKYESKFPKPYSQQKFNESLKEIGKLAGLIENEQVSELRGGQIIKKIVPRYSMISSHTARRTGATQFYLAGIPKRQIMLLTGHTTEVNFDRYIRINKLTNAQELANHEFLKKKEKLPVLEKEFTPGYYWANINNEICVSEVKDLIIYFLHNESLAINEFLNKGGRLIKKIEKPE